jgi:hypothetical protein
MRGLRRLPRRMYEEIAVKEIADKAGDTRQRQAVAFFCYIMMPVSIMMVPMAAGMPVQPPVYPLAQ